MLTEERQHELLRAIADDMELGATVDGKWVERLQANHVEVGFLHDLLTCIIRGYLSYPSGTQGVLVMRGAAAGIHGHRKKGRDEIRNSGG
jgi:hypothetical protein